MRVNAGKWKTLPQVCSPKSIPPFQSILAGGTPWGLRSHPERPLFRHPEACDESRFYPVSPVRTTAMLHVRNGLDCAVFQVGEGLPQTGMRFSRVISGPSPAAKCTQRPQETSAPYEVSIAYCRLDCL